MPGQNDAMATSVIMKKYDLIYRTLKKKLSRGFVREHLERVAMNQTKIEIAFLINPQK